jgi:hypothetical protein
VLESLREAGNLELHDFFTFVFGSATQNLDAAPSGGARFPVDARLAGRTFAKFYMDVSTGDVLREPYETLSGRDWLGLRESSAQTSGSFIRRTIRRETPPFHFAEWAGTILASKIWLI